MIRHMVMWRFKEDNRLKNIDRAIEQLHTLVKDINDIIHLETHKDIGDKSTSNFDLVLITDFEDLDALNRYQIHPSHKKVGEFIKKVVSHRACVDAIG